jgi:hypothetical protein
VALLNAARFLQECSICRPAEAEGVQAIPSVTSPLETFKIEPTDRGRVAIKTARGYLSPQVRVSSREVVVTVACQVYLFCTHAKVILSSAGSVPMSLFCSLMGLFATPRALVVTRKRLQCGATQMARILSARFMDDSCAMTAAVLCGEWQQHCDQFNVNAAYNLCAQSTK